jgi:integrase
MPRPPKLRKKNGYWMTKAGGIEKYFGHASTLSYSEARKTFAAHLKGLDSPGNRREIVSCLEVCDRHLDWVKRHRSDALYRQRKHFLDRWCNFQVPRRGAQMLVRDVPYSLVSEEDLQAWLDDLRGKQLGPSTIRSAQTAVKACWNWAAKNKEGPMPKDYRPFLEMPKVSTPQKELTEADLLTEVEIKQLFKKADADLAKVRADNGRYRTRATKEYRKGESNPYRQFMDLLHCYYHTGARTSELALIRVRNVLRRTKQVVLGQHKRSETLSEEHKTTRRITLNDESFAIFERYCKDKSAEDYVFTQTSGRPWTKDRLNDRFARVRSLAKVRDAITIYSFRHLWISEALMAGNDIATVAKMAGTSIQMVEKVYGHFRNDHFSEAQRRLDHDRSQRRKPK